MDLNALIQAIAGIASPTNFLRDKLQRDENAIKLLKQFKLDPEHPPADFSGVYAYALVEYGVGKPKPLLDLFRQETLKLSFRKAFDRNNPSIVLSEVDNFIDSYALGDEIGSLGLDVKREVGAFAIVFIEVAKRSRNPGDVLMDQNIGSLHKKIAGIQEQLDRLPTIEGIRTEMARLALPSVQQEYENQCRAIALAQQMRGWFETLDYRFEKYQVWAEDYFEWIINIPVRRSRYSRIFIRGIAGEAGLKDVMALRDSVEAQRTDEGWLVTARRISRAARDEVDKEENRHLDCYTFDELLDQDADFTDYIDWLEREIKHREVDRKYVPLACTKEEIDPVTKQRIGESRYNERDGWIDGYIDLWLDDPAKEHISILGEFGTGKTWFAFHYAWTALQRYKDAQRRGIERPRLPLIITLRDYAKALNVENVLAGFFFTQHNIRLNNEVFEQLNRMGKLLLIFDGFDEMAARVDRQQMINNFWELAKVVVPGAKVILTCRTEHFPSAKEGRALLNAELQASTAGLTGETPQFEVLELEKFDNGQIRQVLLHQASPTTVEEVMGNPQLLDLARRPVMTELILEALPDIEAGKPVDMSRVYLYAVQRKMSRDIKSSRTFTSLADKLYFLCELSWEMLLSDRMSLSYKLFPDRIRRLFGVTDKDLDHWHYDMMGQTMLIRNADGDYTPAHRSLLEFFVAYKFAAELGALAEDFTSVARSRSHINNNIPPIDYTWSSYFTRQVDEQGQILPSVPLKDFASESLEKLRETFGKAPLTLAVMELLVPMLDNPQSLVDIIKTTRDRFEESAGYIGGNAATLAVKIDKTALEEQDLSGTVIKGADLTDASLRGVNLTGANLESCTFMKVLGAVFSVAFSPDGKFIATGDANCEVNIWQSDGQQVLNCKGHIGWVRAVTFSPDGTILASAGYDKLIKLWDARTGECLKTLKGDTNRINHIAISPDGKTLVSSGYDQINLWDLNAGEFIRNLQGHSRRVNCVAITPNGNIFASSSDDKTIKLWNIHTGELLKTLEGHTGIINSLAINQNGTILASCSYDASIKLWDIHTGECLKTILGHTDKIESVVFSRDGQTIISGSFDQTIKIWNVITGECIKTLEGHTTRVRAIAISPDGRIIVSGSDDETVKLWNVNTGECIKTLKGQTSTIHSVVFSPNNRNLISGSENQKVKIWDIHTGKMLISLQGHTSRVNSVAISPNGKIIASGSHDRAVKLWDATSGKCLKTLQGHSLRSVNTVAFSPDSLTLISGSADKTIKLWDISTVECLKTFQGHTDWIWSAIFSPDGTIIASGGDDKTVRLWDVATGECIKTLEHNHWVHSVSFSPYRKILASGGGGDKTVKLWDVDSGKCFQILGSEDSCKVSSIAFSPDDRTLAIGSYDETVRLWDIYSGKCTHILRGHNNGIDSVAFNLDGTILASGSWDETIKIWDVRTGSCIKTLTYKPYEAMNITGVRGLTQTEIATLKALGAVEGKI